MIVSRSAVVGVVTMRPVTHDGSGVAQRVAAVGETLAGRVDDLTDDVQEVIIGLIPDLRADAVEILHDSIRENIETAVHGLATLQDSNDATAPTMRGRVRPSARPGGRASDCAHPGVPRRPDAVPPALHRGTARHLDERSR